MSERQGLYGKYITTKADGSPVDPGAQYFTLRIDTDLGARKALVTYIEHCADHDRQLARELSQWLVDTPIVDAKP